ncbi:DUF4358 domain-containing protein [Fredinandcohnia quinoae]|uniref:DUF4358 domain-containing protein n=1 Tax=Fredinandcohnia quinoae TaxID=2918902 RepID=A0AAW5E953_9BACI|nr:DUF4358 domain-containing protein [Fredinandcohnia sp. SECRCQ15]MCH1625916.1 DUF4358 domain-containing protein [Fredinandcohnia sp. SECRCQ15]
MKKISILVVTMFCLLLVVACSNEADKKKEETPEPAPKVSLEKMATEIKEQIAEDLKAGGVTEPLVDGKLQMYIEANLKDSTESDPGVPIYLERMQINQEDLANGVVVGAMMNVNSDEIIVLEAADEEKVDALKEALEREKAAQNQTWEQYLPDQYEKVKKNIIKTNGTFLIYITYDNPESIEKIFDNQFK